MSVQYGWDGSDQTVYLIQVAGRWTLDEYYTHHIAATQEIESVSHPIILIVDFSRSSAPPTSFLSTGRFSATHKAKNLHMTIIIGANRIIQALINVFDRAFPGYVKKIKLVATLDEARQIAAEEMSRARRMPNE